MEAVTVKELPLVPLVNLQELFTLAVEEEAVVDKVVVHHLLYLEELLDLAVAEKAEMEQDNQRKMERMVLPEQAEVLEAEVLLVEIVVMLGLELLEVPALC